MGESDQEVDGGIGRMSNTTKIMKAIIEKECVIAKRCDACGKNIPPISKSFPREHTPYYEIKTHHNDWGNDSIESYEYKDACSLECALKICQEYIPYGFKGNNSRTIEVEHRSWWVLEGLDDHN